MFLLQSKKPKPAISTHSSSKTIDSSSLAKKKSSFSTGSGKKLTKKNQTHKRKKSAAVSVTETVNGLDDLEDMSTTPAATTTNSFVSGQVEMSNTVRSSHSIAVKNAEHKRALVEMKRLEKKRLEEERLLREKENLRLQEILEKQRQEQLQHQEKTNANNSVNDFLGTQKIKYPYVTPGQVSCLAEIERRRISEERLELSAADETLNAMTAQSDQEVDKMLQRAKEAEATFLAELKEHERLQRIKKVSK